MLLDGLQGLSGWQWIFIIEAIPTLVMSIVCLFTLPEFPETTSCKFIGVKKYDIKIAI